MNRGWRGIWSCILVWLLWGGTAQAGVIAERLSAFPEWQALPKVEAAVGDLPYPDWFAGTWQVTTALVDLVAPLAPELVTPGFESNRRYLHQPIPFQVRFVPLSSPQKPIVSLVPATRVPAATTIVADRAFNGLNLARAYLGDRGVLSVNVDPTNPNRQVTRLPANRQLVSIVTGRAIEAPDADHFLTTEVFQQFFRGAPQPYFNQVETTTAYQYQPEAQMPIQADQVTAIYLSPQDPDYFKAGDRPVALYRYRMLFSFVSSD